MADTEQDGPMPMVYSPADFREEQRRRKEAEWKLEEADTAKEKAQCARDNAVQQATTWAQEARTQRAIVSSILGSMELPDEDWHAETLVAGYVATLKEQVAEAERRVAMLRDGVAPLFGGDPAKCGHLSDADMIMYATEASDLEVRLLDEARARLSRADAERADMLAIIRQLRNHYGVNNTRLAHDVDALLANPAAAQDRREAAPPPAPQGSRDETKPAPGFTPWQGGEPGEYILVNLASSIAETWRFHDQRAGYAPQRTPADEPASSFERYPGCSRTDLAGALMNVSRVIVNADGSMGVGANPCNMHVDLTRLLERRPFQRTPVVGPGERAWQETLWNRVAPRGLVWTLRDDEDGNGDLWALTTGGEGPRVQVLTAETVALCNARNVLDQRLGKPRWPAASAGPTGEPTGDAAPSMLGADTAAVERFCHEYGAGFVLDIAANGCRYSTKQLDQEGFDAGFRCSKAVDALDAALAGTPPAPPPSVGPTEAPARKPQLSGEKGGPDV